MSINAINDPLAIDIVSAVIVQIAIAAIFITSFIGFILTL